MRLLRRYLFFGFLIIICVTFFTRKSMRGVNDIASQLLQEPQQVKINEAPVISFEKDGYRYNLTPLFEYRISSLLVSKINYKMFSIYKYESIFPVDLCLIWGSNLSRGLHQDSALSFKQDCRWCWVNWRRNIGFNMNEFSNNHLLINDARIERIVHSLLPSDQITIRGKLVNVNAQLIGKGDDYSPAQLKWNTSVRRTDTGAGACEVIYVEDVEIIRKANMVSRWLYVISAWGLLFLFVWSMIDFFFGA